MSTRLHALGFAVDWTPELLGQLDVLAASKSKLVGAAKGNYRVWRSQQGAELWFHYPRRHTSTAGSAEGAKQLPQSERPVAVTPFHRGLSACQIKVGRHLAVDRVNPLEGSCMAWLPPPAAGGQEQVVVLELSPYGLQPLRTPPYTATAQIVCLAHAAWAYKDVADYAAATPVNRRIHFGSVRSITAASVPEVKLSYTASPITLGLLTGTVKRSIRHANPITGEPYYWLLVGTKRGAIDVIANPTQVQGDISEGNIVQVCGSLLARLSGTPV